MIRLKPKLYEVSISDKNLLEAISIRFDRHFPAMNIARMFGGGSTVQWTILEQFKPAELLAEAKEREIDLSALEVAMATCECCPRLVVQSELFIKLEGK